MRGEYAMRPRTRHVHWSGAYDSIGIANEEKIQGFFLIAATNLAHNFCNSNNPTV